jgi:hypothetical protein
MDQARGKQMISYLPLTREKIEMLTKEAYPGYDPDFKNFKESSKEFNRYFSNNDGGQGMSRG